MPSYEPVDLSAACNAGVDVLGDEPGDVPLGRVDLRGLPFLIGSEPPSKERCFLLPGAPAPDRFAYLPFGVGPRVCIGAQFALTEAILVLAAMIKAFHIEPADDEPVEPVAIVTTQPDRAPLFRLRSRR